jgi:hypothetical protein
VQALNSGTRLCFRPAGEIECSVFGIQERGEVKADASVTAGYEMDLLGVLGIGWWIGWAGGYFAGLVWEVCLCEAGKGDEEGLIPERGEFLTHGCDFVLNIVSSVLCCVDSYVGYYMTFLYIFASIGHC